VKIVLVSTYELGRQPFGLASPAAWLRRGGYSVTCVDLAVGTLPSLAIREADLVAFHLPMHTATRLAAQAISRIKPLNPAARLCCYGLYAPMNEAYLRGLGVEHIVGGEFEAGLLAIADGVTSPSTLISLDRLQFEVPDRSGLPALSRYAKLHINGDLRTAGYTEASRGCKHRCRHCPVVPVYNGTFRVVQSEVVMEDIRRQIAAGAAHITFGDPDFFNGPGHAVKLVELLYREFPRITYDVTIKVEHLRQQRDLLPVLRDTGCLFVTSAVESVDDAVLTALDKGHTRREFIEVVEEFRRIGLTLAPTFIPFTPWTTWAGYRDLLRVIRDVGLVENVSPIQLALRLLIVPGSRLLELPGIQKIIGPLDQAALIYRWKHEDPTLDSLAASLLRLINAEQKKRVGRPEIFRQVWAAVCDETLPENYELMPRATIPYLDEPWYC
jgi:radical SAM superfamily enzyme YgiQ (UPF0313 family)